MSLTPHSSSVLSRQVLDAASNLNANDKEELIKRLQEQIFQERGGGAGGGSGGKKSSITSFSSSSSSSPYSSLTHPIPASDSASEHHQQQHLTFSPPSGNRSSTSRDGYASPGSKYSIVSPTFHSQSHNSPNHNALSPDSQTHSSSHYNNNNNSRDKDHSNKPDKNDFRNISHALLRNSNQHHNIAGTRSLVNSSLVNSLSSTCSASSVLTQRGNMTDSCGPHDLTSGSSSLVNTKTSSAQTGLVDSRHINDFRNDDDDDDSDDGDHDHDHDGHTADEKSDDDVDDSDDENVVERDVEEIEFDEIEDGEVVAIGCRSTSGSSSTGSSSSATSSTSTCIPGSTTSHPHQRKAKPSPIMSMTHAVGLGAGAAASLSPLPEESSSNSRSSSACSSILNNSSGSKGALVNTVRHIPTAQLMAQIHAVQNNNSSNNNNNNKHRANNNSAGSGSSVTSASSEAEDEPGSSGSSQNGGNEQKDKDALSNTLPKEQRDAAGSIVDPMNRYVVIAPSASPSPAPLLTTSFAPAEVTQAIVLVHMPPEKEKEVFKPLHNTFATASSSALSSSSASSSSSSASASTAVPVRPVRRPRDRLSSLRPPEEAKIASLWTPGSHDLKALFTYLQQAFNCSQLDLDVLRIESELENAREVVDWYVDVRSMLHTMDWKLEASIGTGTYGKVFRGIEKVRSSPNWIDPIPPRMACVKVIDLSGISNALQKKGSALSTSSNRSEGVLSASSSSSPASNSMGPGAAPPVAVNITNHEAIRQEILLWMTMSEAAPQGTPNLLSIYDASLHYHVTQLWVSCEWMSFGSLADIYVKRKAAGLMHSSASSFASSSQQQGCMPEHLVSYVIRSCLLGLQQLYTYLPAREGRVESAHGAIKPANILINHAGEVKLSDRALSFSQLDHTFKQQGMEGVYYEPPEIMTEAKPNQRFGDAWQLGILTLELIDGKPPHFGLHPLKVCQLIPRSPAPTIKSAGASQQIREFIGLCCQKVPAQRATITQLLEHPFIKLSEVNPPVKELIQFAEGSS